MSNQLPQQGLYRFGEFVLQTEKRTLESKAGTVSVTPKMMDILFLFLRSGGKALTKDTILNKVWPDTFVEEGNIAYNIRQLRKALGDDVQAPRYIETIPKVGYRFVAEVVFEPTVEPEEVDTPETPKQARARTSRLRFAWIGVVVASILAAGTLFWFSTRSNQPKILETQFAAEKLTSDGNIQHTALSQDGKKFVYTNRSGERQSLWVRHLETADNVEIIPPTATFYGGLALSPDGETVYFARRSGDQDQLDIYKMPVFGGIPLKIVENTQGWISISPDGSSVSYVRCPYGEADYCSLFVAGTKDGGNEKKLVTKPSPTRIADNQISPDGNRIAFAYGHSRTAANEFALGEVDIDRATERALTTEKFFNIRYLAYLPGDAGLIMSAMKRRDGNYPIWRVNGGAVTRLTSDSEDYSRLSLDNSGTKLLATRTESDFKVQLYDSSESEPRILSVGSTAAFTPEGSILFTSIRSGNSDIWSINSDGSGLHQLTNDEFADQTPVISHDGKHIYFATDRSGSVQVWQMTRDGLDKKQLTKDEGGYPQAISSDGRYLYYQSGINNGLDRIDLESLSVESILPETGRFMTVSPDGSLAAYVERKAEATYLKIFSLTSRSEVGKFDLKLADSNISVLTWSSKSDKVGYLARSGDRKTERLFLQNVSGGEPSLLRELRADATTDFSVIAMSPLDDSFAVVKGQWRHDAVLIKGLK